MSSESETVPEATTTTTSAAALMQPMEVAAQSTPTTDVESLVESAPAIANKKWWKGGKAWLALMAVFVVLCAAIVTMYALSSPAADAQESAQDKAFLTLQQLGEDGVDDEDHRAFDAAFDTFDINHDGVLDADEFTAFFAREMSFSAEFERMDVDGDDVLSYPETVAYVQQMGEIEAMRDYLIESLSGVIAAAFDFEVEVGDAASLAQFLEYVAVVAYFGTYDTDINGYVRHDEFTAIAAQNEFAAFASENERGVSRDAFFDLLYGDDEFSWTGTAHEIYGEHCEDTLRAWNEVEISAEMVRDVEITLNPTQILRDIERAEPAQEEADPNAKVIHPITMRMIFQGVEPVLENAFKRRLQGGTAIKSNPFVGFPGFCSTPSQSAFCAMVAGHM